MSDHQKEIKYLFTEILNEITKCQRIKQYTYPTYEFKENDFVFLDNLLNGSNFNLVVDKETLHIFLMKDVKDKKREIYFCENYKHRIFTRVYGFIKDENNETIKIIYEYMSNDNLERFIKKRKIKLIKHIHF